jgi:hypothetical protein
MQFPCRLWYEQSNTYNFKISHVNILGMTRLNNKFFVVQYGYLILFRKADKFTKEFSIIMTAIHRISSVLKKNLLQIRVQPPPPPPPPSHSRNWLYPPENEILPAQP